MLCFKLFYFYFGTNLNLIKLCSDFVFLQLFFVMNLFLQMSHRSSRGKEPVIDLTSSPVSKRTRHLSEVSNNKRFKTPLDSRNFSSTFQDAPTVVERIV